MRSLPALVLFAVLLPAISWVSLATAQSPPRAAGLTAAQAERNAVDLKQGMSVEDVQRLLGKPRRTSLKNNGHSSSPPQSTLQWTYQWTTNASSPAVLQVEFEAKTPDAWQVNNWGWASY